MTIAPKRQTESRRFKRGRVVTKFQGKAEGATQQARREERDVKRRELIEKMRQQKDTIT